MKRSEPRIRSNDADAFHSKYAFVGPQLIECSARFQGDDGLNICGEYYMIMTSQDRQLRILATRECNIQAGDRVELLAYDGRRFADAKAVAITPDTDGIRPEEAAFIMKLQMHPNIKGKLCSPESKAFKVTLDSETKLQMGSLIASANRTGNGFLVKGCNFSYNRSRGILIKASNGQVIGNTITATWGEGIKVAPEYYWLESGSSNNVLIKDNKISKVKPFAIAVYATGGNGWLSPEHITTLILKTT